MMLPVQTEVNFSDGSIVRCQLLVKEIVLQTKYGELKIPIVDIREIRFEKQVVILLYEGQASGKLVSPLKMKSPYFPETILKYGELRFILFKNNAGKEIEKVILSDQAWLDTGVIVNKERFLITAFGAVDIWPQAPGQYMTGAKGYNVSGKGSNFPAGALIGKVGSNIFLIGERWDAEIPYVGNLFLQIVPSPWDNDSVGQYKVRIKGL